MKLPWQRLRDERDASLDDEIRGHLAMAIADRIARGESPEEAVTAARREFGNVGHVKEVTREMWGGVWLERLGQDLAYATRSLRRSPGFSTVAVMTLALGIGVNTAMFTVMNGVLIRSLPFRDPHQLFVASYAPPRSPFMSIDGLFDAHFLQFQKSNSIFERVTTFASSSVTMTGGGEPANVRAELVTPDFFEVLGVRPALGRALTAGDDVVGGDNVIVLSDALWRKRFSGDPEVLGSMVELDGTERIVVGVMPASFDFPVRSDLWAPLRVTTSARETRIRTVVGRLKVGMTPEQAATAWTATTANFEVSQGFDPQSFIARLIPLKLAIVGDARRPLLIFAGAVAFVLLIACANVANLLLMRVASRDREIAVRAALGAGRWRLIRQLLTETFVISTLGSVAGIGLALAGVRMLLSLAPGEMLPRAENVRLDGWVLAFAIGLSAATTLLCGLIPALHATEQRLRGSLAEGAPSVTGGRGRARATLVVGEMALAVVLLAGAGLMLRSFHRMQSVDLGFRPADVLVTTVDLPIHSYRSANEMRAFHQRVIDGLAAIPGAHSVGAVNWLPLGGNLIAGDFHIEGGPALPPNYRADKLVVTPNYFRALGLRLERGRDFTAQDRVGAPGVVILSHSIAERFWPRGDAVGKRITMSDKPGLDDWVTIVGVVNDVVQVGVTSQPDAAIYQPLAQTTQPFFISRATYVVRPQGDSRSIAPAVREVLRAADLRLPLGSVSAMSEIVDGTMLTPRFQSRMLLAFSLLALTLSVIGIYGVLAYGVAQRRHEIGVRIALGALPTQVMRMVLRRTAALVLPGLVIGLLSSLALTRVLTKFLFQVTPTDPITFASVAVVLGSVALAAAYVPARRASRVDPLIALGQD